MNEQIKQLEQQAMTFRGGIQMLDTDKFAELIIQECAKVAVEAESTGVARLIMIHFGIEE